MKIVRIFAHDEFPQEAAELFEKERIVAVGWSELGDLTGLTYDEIKEKSKKLWKRTESQSAKDASQLVLFRDGIDVGDVVFAYVGGNKVALVGKIIGNYKFYTKNNTGNLTGKIAYANQRKVEWWNKPKNFNRSYLPLELSKFVSLPGTISVKSYKLNKLSKELESVPSQETVNKALEIHDEKEIKDYMEGHLNEIEKGLTLVKREHATSESGTMDFLAKDANGFFVAIEVKVNADDSDVPQLRRYMRAYKSDSQASKIRGILIAEDFSKRCLEDIKELSDLGMNIRACKCRKQFGFERLL